MKNYTQLTEAERNQIYALKQAGFKPSVIALQLGRHKSTISRELRRNRGLRGYRPKQGQQMAAERRREKVKLEISKETLELVDNLLSMRIGVLNKSAAGWLSKKTCRSAKSEFISMSPATKSWEEACAFIYAAERKEENVMEALTGGVRSEIEHR